MKIATYSRWIPRAKWAALALMLHAAIALPANGFVQQPWTTLDTGVPYSIYGTHFVDARNGYAVAWHPNLESVVLSTTSAGANWTTEFTRDNAFLFSVISEGSLIIAVGHVGTTNSGLVLWSHDAGQTWNEQALPTTFGLYDVVLVNPTTAFASGYDGSIYKSVDSAVTWTRLPTGTTTEVFRGLSFVNETLGYALGGTAFQGKSIYRTADAGASWTRVKQFGPQTVLSDLHFFPEHPSNGRHGLVAGFRGGRERVLKTTDGGLTWTPVMQGSSGVVLQCMSFARAKGWAAGVSNSVYYSEDAGNTWTQMAAPGSFIGAVSLVPGGVYMGGGNGNVYRRRMR